jgi:hypothetical protein
VGVGLGPGPSADGVLDQVPSADGVLDQVPSADGVLDQVPSADESILRRRACVKSTLFLGRSIGLVINPFSKNPLTAPHPVPGVETTMVFS